MQRWSGIVIRAKGLLKNESRLLFVSWNVIHCAVRNKPLGPEMPHFSALFSLFKWHWIIRAWQKESTNTTKPWPRPLRSKEPETRSDEPSFTCQCMRKVVGQEPIHLDINGSEMAGKWAPYNPPGERDDISCLPKSRRTGGVWCWRAAGFRDYFPGRADKLKPTTPRHVYLPTDRDES